jgi:hypothetical protein
VTGGGFVVLFSGRPPSDKPPVSVRSSGSPWGSPGGPRVRWAPSGRARRSPSPCRGEGGKSPRREASSGATGREASSSGTRLPPPLPPHRRRSWPHERDSGESGRTRSCLRPSAPSGLYFLDFSPPMWHKPKRLRRRHHPRSFGGTG